MPSVEFDGLLLLVQLSDGLVGYVFAISAYAKFRNPDQVRRAIAFLMNLPPKILRAIPALLIIIEALIAFSLLTAYFVLPARSITLMVLAIFTGAVAILLRGGYGESCGCLGSVKTAVSWRHVLLNIILFSLMSFATVIDMTIGSPTTPGAWWLVRVVLSGGLIGVFWLLAILVKLALEFRHFDHAGSIFRARG